MNLLFKMGFYSVYEEVNRGKTKYTVDSGKTIYSQRFKKVLPNPYRDVKSFNSLEDAKQYIVIKLSKHKETKTKKIESLPKSLYLIVMKEEKTGNRFVKVGITSKRFIARRFSKDYGYEGYHLEAILRRVDTKDAEKLESLIKDKLSKKRGVKKFRPLLENFSGYSECFDYNNINEITDLFDRVTKNS